MKIILPLLLMLLPGLNIFSQPFQIGHTTITFADTSRNNRTVETELYYPADVAGNNVPFTIAVTDRFPVLSFGHGFVMTWDAYQNIWDAVVPEGFIIAFPKTEGSLSPSHLDFGKDLAFVISALNALGLDSSSLFFNRIDTMNCVLGHSMGGGAAFLSALQIPEVKTLAVLAPAETNPSAIQASTGLTIPSLIFAGGNDCVTPPPDNQIPMYDSSGSICKTLITINGGSHCQMAENNFLCNFGESTCTPPPSITRAEQHSTINRYLLAWLKYELKFDCISGGQFDSLVATDTSITFQKSCSLCLASTIEDYLEITGIDFFPNPFTDKINILNKDALKCYVSIELYQPDGRKVFFRPRSIIFPGEILTINLKNYCSSGIYFLATTVNGKQVIKKIVKI